MGYRVTLTKDAIADLDRLDRTVAKRIIKKMRWFSLQDDPLYYAVPMIDAKVGDMRFRIGDYRAIVVADRKRQLLIVVAFGHRSEIYKR